MDREELELLAEPLSGPAAAAMRRRLELTQADVAALIDVTQGWLSQIENGRKTMPPYVAVTLRLLMAAKARDSLIAKLQQELTDNERRRNATKRPRVVSGG